MKNKTHLMLNRRLVVVVWLLALALLAACRGGGQPDLVIPTPSVALTGVPSTGVPSTGVPPTIAPTAELPSPVPPTIAPTATPVVVASPTLAPTRVPATATPAEPTATATPIATFAPIGGGDDGETEYRVAFVTAGDVLNVRRQPSPDAAIVTRLRPDATGIAVIGGGQTAVGGSVWLPIETAEGDGWVNSAFLTEAVDRQTFCADAAVSELLDRFEEAIAERDGELLSQLVHPERGLRLRLNWWNEEIIVRGDDLAGLFRSTTAHDWGIEDGSGDPIRGSFRDVALPRLERDLLGAGEWACDEGRFGPTAGSTVLPEGYEAVRYFSAHRPAPSNAEFDWGTWLIGVERWEGQYFVSFLVHYRWEI